MGTDIHGVWQTERFGKWIDVESTYMQDRDYQLFAVLAGVRNGTGFAGVKTGEPVKPIAMPRGLPDGFAMKGDSHPVARPEFIDPDRREWMARDGRDLATLPLEELSAWMGDHSHSWLTSTEMLAWFDTAPVVKACGVIERSAYASWTGGRPDGGWRGDVWGGVVTQDDPGRYDDLNDATTHVRVSWDRPLKEALSEFFDEVRRLHDLHGEVRFVFGFDS